MLLSKLTAGGPIELADDGRGAEPARGTGAAPLIDPWPNADTCSGHASRGRARAGRDDEQPYSRPQVV